MALWLKSRVKLLVVVVVDDEGDQYVEHDDDAEQVEDGEEDSDEGDGATAGDPSLLQELVCLLVLARTVVVQLPNASEVQAAHSEDEEDPSKHQVKASVEGLQAVSVENTERERERVGQILFICSLRFSRHLAASLAFFLVS